MLCQRSYALFKKGYSILTIHGQIFYPHAEPGVPGTPNPVFQPKTPVFTGSRPMEEMKAQPQTFQDPMNLLKASRAIRGGQGGAEPECPGR